MGAEFITFEITETAMLQNPGEIHYRLSQWNELGLATSIDDFGTGYSSLSHLKRYPMRELKIDRSFVKDMVTSDDDMMIVRSTLDISHNMRMRVVAEGVEDESMLGMLADMGCDIIQGYFLTPPLPLGEFAAWLKNSPYQIGMSATDSSSTLRRQDYQKG
jgi:EAL domain-containing protein (putative c-di-GMP-specific phosphodiesterase class I)